MADPVVQNNAIDVTTFKAVATNAIVEHEELRKRYSQKIAEFQELQVKYQDTEDSLLKLTNVTQKACEEMVYFNDKIENELDVEQRCREEAEHYASKMVNENKKILKQNRDIKTKSMALLGSAGLDLQAIEINLDVISEGDSDMSEEQQMLLDELQHQVNDLTIKLQKTHADIDKLEKEKSVALANIKYYKDESHELTQQLALESTSHQVTKSALKDRDKMLDRLNRVSTMVINEYQSVSDKYEEESVLREKAEDFAAKMYSQKKAADAVQRQSMLVLSDTLEDGQKTTELLLELETLTTTLEKERQDHNKELDEIKAALKDSEDNSARESLEEQLKLAGEEISSSELRVKDLEEKNAKLAKELDDAIEAARPPPPPAPPPPPPPLVQTNPLGILRKIMNKNAKAAGAKKEDPTQSQYNATIDEMMKRITSGRTGLRPAVIGKSAPAKTDGSLKNTQAVVELDSILQNIKTKHASKFTAIPGTGSSQKGSEDALSEFEKIMRKQRAKTSIKRPNTAHTVTFGLSEPAKTNLEVVANRRSNKTLSATADTLDSIQQNGADNLKKFPVPAPRPSARSRGAPARDRVEQPSPSKDTDHDVEVEMNPLYDSVGEDEYSDYGPPPLPKTRSPPDMSMPRISSEDIYSVVQM